MMVNGELSVPTIPAFMILKQELFAGLYNNNNNTRSELASLAHSFPHLPRTAQ